MSTNRQENEVDIYVDGRRYRGTLLATNATTGSVRGVGTLPSGTTIVVGFSTQPGSVFVVGTTASTGPTADSIVHAAWHRAETRGTPEMLRGFVERLFGIAGAKVRVIGEKSHAEPRAVFVFPSLEDEETEERPPVDTSKTNATVTDSRPAVPIPPLPTHQELSGVLTTLVSRGGLRVPTNIPAEINTGKVFKPARVLFLGLTGMFVRVEDLDSDPARDRPAVRVRFLLQVEGRSVTVRALCRVLTIDEGETTGTPGLDLDFIRSDDGANGAMLKTFVQSLQLQAIARD